MSHLLADSAQNNTENELSVQKTSRSTHFSSLYTLSKKWTFLVRSRHYFARRRLVENWLYDEMRVPRIKNKTDGTIRTCSMDSLS